MQGTVFGVFLRSHTQLGAESMLHVPASACRGWHEGPLELSYAQMAQRIELLRDRYAAARYGSGHRVALLLDNRPEFFAHWLALNALGASVVPLNAEQPPAALGWQLAHSGAVLVVALPERAALAREALRHVQAPCEGMQCDETPPLAMTPATGEPPTSSSECALLYTSGSTGQPKGCMLGNEYFTRFGEWYARIGGLCELRPGCERLITPLPLSHMNAMATSTMGMLETGGCIVQLDRFHPNTWWESVRASGATAVHYLGVMPAILLGLPARADDDFGAQVRFGFGAGVNPRHHAAFEQRFGFPLVEAWAMTESGCGGCIVANREPRHVGSCCFGRAPPEVEYRLVDESGIDVPDGDAGELLVRAAGADPRAGFFSGYLRDPEATAAIWEGGWLHTGDVVRAGEDGALHFVDRRKNVIRRSGENIAALEVEAALADDPRIAQLVVTAVSDELRGEEVMAAVIAREGIAADRETARAIQQCAQETLAYFKVPGYVVFVDTIPRTASQKPQRGEIRALASSWLESASCFDLREHKRRPTDPVGARPARDDRDDRGQGPLPQ